MTPQEFDKHIAEKLAQQQFLPTEKGWQQLQQQIQSASVLAAEEESVAPKNKFVWKRIAAVLIPIIVVAGLYSVINNKNTKSKSVVATAASIPQIVSQKNIENNTKISGVTNAKEKEVSPNLESKSVVNDVKINNSIQTNSVAKNTKTETKPPMVMQPSFIAKDNKTIAENLIKNSIQTSPTEIKSIDTILKKIEKLSAQNYLSLDLSTPTTTKPVNKKPQISVLAGMSTNTNTYYSNGINLGIASTKNINKYLYIDASINVVSNNPSWLQNKLVSNTELRNSIAAASNGYTVADKSEAATFINAYGVNPATNTFAANGNTIPISELTDDQNIAQAAAYRLVSTQLEAAPMIGFRFNKKINIASGVDVAKIITSSSYQKSVDLLLLQALVAPTMRSWDVGAVGKVEYAVTKHMVVGYRHRQGITSMTTTIPTRRNYNGIVLKYQF
jgi:hypothetical protein